VSDKINNGGHAFPQLGVTMVGDMAVPTSEGGMSLRDWFAGQSHQPGTAEAYQLRGCPDFPKPPGWKDESWDGPNNINVRASRWFETLTLDEKYAIYTELRYKIADAMLKARN
jgi:hypothetical protein